MKLQYLIDNGSPRLLLVFAGWSTDASAFCGLRTPGYDMAVLSDFTSLDMPELRCGYSEVVVLAWSLGVWAASAVLPRMELPVTLALAVNGTPWPVNDAYGIPAAIYHATAANLTAASFAKFRRRMGGASLPPPGRGVEELAAELRGIALAAGAMRGEASWTWDRAVVSRGDLIFPPANQQAAWAGTRTAVDEMDGPHTPPSWQLIADRYIIDKTLVQTRFERGQSTYADEAGVQQRAAAHLWELWRKHRIPARCVLEFGSGDGTLTRLYAKELKPESLMLWDIVDAPGVTSVCDAETAISTLPSESVDVIASANTVQWFNSPARFLQNAARVLRRGGLLVLSTFGPATFRQLTDAGVVPLPYLSLDSWRVSVPENMEILELHDGLSTKMFAAPLDVLRHLRATGVNARPATVSMQQLLRSYPLARDGRAPLTYNPLYILLRKL